MRLGFLFFWVMAGVAFAEVPPPAPLLTRQANTTLQLPLDPPRTPILSERAFGSLRVTDPLAITAPPGETNRLFIVEQDGRIVVITNLANPTRTVFMDIADRVAGGVPNDERGLLGLVFHPEYRTNRSFYVFYTGLIRTPVGNNLHDILSRFETSADDPNQGLPGSEVRLITQHDEASNHNGGDLHFGPDGYLYISLGDEGGGNDQFSNSQRINKDFFAGILRIDVDKRPGSLPPNVHPGSSTNYAVPPDNPFVGATEFNGLPVNPENVRTEFYAVGLRNPWRMTFDWATGALYVADVGQSAREEVDIIIKGGNYGWAYREGNIAGPKRPVPSGFRGIEPIHVYNHGSSTNQGLSITGGVVYRGSQLPHLSGRYVFADWASGNIWALERHDPTDAANVRAEFLTRNNSVSAFGIDPRNGDILMADQGADTIKRLVATTNVVGTPLPSLLSETGAFADLASLSPHPGIVPYEINLPFWSDNARKSRWFTLRGANQTIGFSPSANWSFPTGAVWVKHFELELTNGVPESARRLETRFIVRNQGGVYGVTYRWNETQTDAMLVPEEGMDETFLIHDAGVTRTQVWHYPSRGECMACHTTVGGLALGFNTAQLNRDVVLLGGRTNQIQALSDAGYFDAPVAGIHTLPVLAHPLDESFSTEYRVRSYLAVNCSNCHQPGGPGRASFDTRLTTPTSEAGLINGPLVSSFDLADRVIKPGSLERSMLLRRITGLRPGVQIAGPHQPDEFLYELRMPPLDSTIVDASGVALISSWITNELANAMTFADWQEIHFGSPTTALAAPDADPDADGAPNMQEYLTGRNPLLPSDAWGVSILRSNESTFIVFPQIANRGFEVQATTDLNDPASWKPLDVPDNAPFFSRNEFTKVVQDRAGVDPAKFYRVRVVEP